LNFRDIELSDRADFEKCTVSSGTMACDASFTNMFIWRKAYKVGYCLKDGFIFRRSESGKYRFPIGGGDICAALKEVKRDSEERGGELKFDALTETQCRILSEAFPERKFSFAKKPDYADYIYNASDLISLSGKKYHAKRNFINRFKQVNDGRYRLSAIAQEDLDEVWVYNKEWCEKNGCLHNLTLLGETCAVRIAFANYNELGLVGRVLKLDGKIIAYSFATRINGETIDVHVEKAEYEIPGAYPIINNALASAEEFEEIRYINREEDMGIEGLRKAKESYHPEILLMRYNAR